MLFGALMAIPSPGASQGLPASYEKLPEKTVTSSPVNVSELVRRYGPVVGRPVPGRRFNPKKESQELQLPPNPIFNPPVPLARVMARSPRISTVGGFDGLPDQGGAPPDGGLAVGPVHIISAGNSAFTITPKNTLVPAAVVQYSTFFTGENQTGVDGLFDPRVEYDPTTDRYMMLILGLDDTNRKSQVLFAVSQTNDPTGNWHRYAFDVKESEGGMDRWLDYASLGFTSDAIVFNGTMFNFPKATAGGSLHATVRILDKAKALSGQPLTPTTLSKFNSNVAAENTIQPVLTYDTGVTTQYLLSAAAEGQVNFFAISNLLTATPTVKYTPLTVNTWVTPPAMAQSGSAVTLDGGDTRMLNAVLRNGRIWATHGIGENIGGTVRGVARVYRVNPAGDGSVEQTFSVSDPVLNLHYPSLDLDGSGNVLLGYSTANSGSPASQAVSLKKTTDANFSAPLIVTPGVAGYKHEAADSNRWGDYSDTQFDPSDPAKVWHLGMVAATTGTWKLRVVSIRTVDESIVVTSPNGGETLRVGTPHTITWNASGFWDTGQCQDRALTGRWHELLGSDFRLYRKQRRLHLHADCADEQHGPHPG